MRKTTTVSRPGPGESSAGRKAGMLAEMGWVTLGLTIQIYVPGSTGWWTVCGMLTAYILWFFRRLQTAPRMVFLLPLSMALGVLGGWNAWAPEDIWEPVHMALAALAVMGVFVAEYNREEDARFLGLLFVVLMPLAVWQSMTRNNLWEEWSEGGRRGVNLQALFLMMAASYGLLLKGGWKLIILPFYGALFLLGSRTGFFTALTVPVIVLLVDGKTRRQVAESLPRLLVGGLAVGVAVAVYQQAFPGGPFSTSERLPSGLSMEGRYSTEAIQEMAEIRAEISRRWLQFLWEKPTLFGHGCRSYSGMFGEEYYPHNGFLNIFNGFGVIAGCLYSWVCLSTVWRLWKRRNAMPPHLVLAGAFFFSMLLRKFGEAQMLVVPVHIAGFGIMYAVGLAIQGGSVRTQAPAAARNWSRLRKRVVEEHALEGANGSDSQFAAAGSKNSAQ